VDRHPSGAGILQAPGPSEGRSVRREDFSDAVSDQIDEEDPSGVNSSKPGITRNQRDLAASDAAGPSTRKFHDDMTIGSHAGPMGASSGLIFQVAI
jgi:hypothetical protein